MIVEVDTFRLQADADEAAFLDADRRVQTEALPNRRGYLRRTTARGASGEWAVVTLWATTADAEAASDALAASDAVRDFDALVDRASRRTGRYETLD